MYMREDSDVLLRSRCFGVYVDLEDSTCTVVDRLSTNEQQSQFQSTSQSSSPVLFISSADPC